MTGTRAVGLCLAVALAAPGLVVLIGWASSLTPLTRLWTPLRPMPASSAACFVLLAASLALLGAERVWPRRLALIPALAATLIGAGSWVEATSELDLGIASFVLDNGHPLKMVKGTAANFTLLGVAFSLAPAGSPRARDAAVVLVVMVAAAALEGLTSWGWTLAFDPDSRRVRAVAVHTVIGLLLACVAALVVRPTDGLGAAVRGPNASRFVTRLLPLALILRLGLGWLTLSDSGAARGVQFGLSAFAVANLLMISAVVLWSSHALADAEGARERARREAEAALAREAERAAVAEALRRAAGAQEDERRRIAQELHDGIGSSLAQVLFELDTLTDRLPAGPEQEGLRRARAHLATTVGEVGRTARGLHPSILEDLGLQAAVEQHVADWRGRSGVDAEVTVTGLAHRRRLPEPVELAAWRLVQEALANVARHARASTASVLVRADDDRLTVMIEDDGAGFDADDAVPRPAALGLRDMRDRVETLGGGLTVESVPGQGTTIRAELPLPTRKPS